MDRLNGGGGRGDHSEALGERGNTFLLRRVSKKREKVRPAMADCLSSLAALGGGEEMRTGAGECVGQVRGVLKTRLAVPGHPWRVACALRRAATGGATRPANSKPVGHNITERFLKNRDSVITDDD